ncbi:MAG: bifunctional heptose 7-phosphate kinase/heptose 1-phosphate adenyltransferase [Deltaproteobacteria bacterium]|nr:MAG: bifunctional heptose 7-phosphate kinase/heptose 1-phosphate adenyltransferase [Deltaproteobacteria bacterium]
MRHLPDFSQAKLLVMGDVMLDRYVWGTVNRISPEAPVPVVRTQETTDVLGGAGNVAANLSSLGCQVQLLGICGTDEPADRLYHLFDEKGVDGHLEVADDRPTITKTRIMSQGQQLFRLDKECDHPIPETAGDRLMEAFEKRLVDADGVILSDYGKGVFGRSGFTEAVIEKCRKAGVPVCVDPKGTDWERYCYATAITPNTAEFEAVAGAGLDRVPSEMSNAAKTLCRKFSLDALLVTRGGKGMCLVTGERPPYFIPSRAREVFDVSGAGDTVIAVFAAGLALRIPFAVAADLANRAAGIVVGQLGTRPVNLDALAADYAYGDPDDGVGRQDKILSRDAAACQVVEWQDRRFKVVFTNGCFDLLHPGHIQLLEQARAQGDCLVVGLNSDASVRRLKGPARPILTERDRSAVLSALACVDAVVIFEQDTPLELIGALKPDILVKGSDYALHEIVGRDVVEAYGGEVRRVQILDGYSTTRIADQLSRRE